MGNFPNLNWQSATKAFFGWGSYSDLPTLKKPKIIFVHPKICIFHTKIVFFRTKILEHILNIYSLFHIHCSYLVWYKRKNAEFMMILKLNFWFKLSKVRKTNWLQQLFFVPMIAFEWCQFIQTSEVLDIHTALTNSHGNQQNIKFIGQPIFVMTSFIGCYNRTSLSVANKITWYILFIKRST